VWHREGRRACRQLCIGSRAETDRCCRTPGRAYEESAATRSAGIVRIEPHSMTTRHSLRETQRLDTLRGLRIDLATRSRWNIGYMWAGFAFWSFAAVIGVALPIESAKVGWMIGGCATFRCASGVQAARRRSIQSWKHAGQSHRIGPRKLDWHFDPRADRDVARLSSRTSAGGGPLLRCIVPPLSLRRSRVALSQCGSPHRITATASCPDSWRLCTWQQHWRCHGDELLGSERNRAQVCLLKGSSASGFAGLPVRDNRLAHAELSTSELRTEPEHELRSENREA